jgi:hypothetical protein
MGAFRWWTGWISSRRQPERCDCLPHPDTNCAGPRPTRLVRILQYRILYFFHGRNTVVLSHGITKSQKVPAQEIERAIVRKQLVLRDPSRYAHRLAPKEI